jgi:hypothetical protein
MASNGNLSNLVFLSDCTPVYYILGTPGKITQFSLHQLNGAIRILWSPPENSSEIPIDNYIIRYGKTSDPGNMINGYTTTSLSTIIINNLVNGVSYRFWISATNLFGEGVLSDPQSIEAGAAPDPITLVRRSYHSTIATQPLLNMQKVGIEFVPPLNYNGRIPSTYTIKYSQHNVPNAPVYEFITPVNENTILNELMVDQSFNPIYHTTGFAGNYVRREIEIPNTIIPGNYIFTVFSTNIYGTSTASLQNIIVTIGGSRFISPFLSLPSGNILETIPGDNKLTFKWKQTTLIPSSVNGVGWKYRIQYTNNKNYWYYPVIPPLTSSPFLEYEIPYDTSKLPGVGIYSFDLSHNVYNGTRYYIRYSIVNPAGDTSQYTLSNETNESITSNIPGKLPNPPDMFTAAVGDRTINLYFSWYTTSSPNDPKTDKPSITKTGGYPILDYRIERYIISTDSSFNTVFDISYSNIIGPFFSDSSTIRNNGVQYQYRIFTRTQIGYSLSYNSLIAIPVRKSNIVYNVSSTVGLNQITLQWQPPAIESGTPIVEYYIEYKIYDKYSIPIIPPANIIGSFTNSLTVSKNINDMNSILVNDDLWAIINTTKRELRTGSSLPIFTIKDLVNFEIYIFRVAAVTQDISRRNTIGLLQVIGNNSPYLPNPKIIGKVPSPITDNINFINLDRQINISWSSKDILNTENIVNFIIEYQPISNPDSVINTAQITKLILEYNNCISNYSSNEVFFNIIISGLSNNINNKTNSHSYNVYVYAENSVGYTNTNDRLYLNTPNLTLYDTIYGSSQQLRRYVRPGTIPAIFIS